MNPTTNKQSALMVMAARYNVDSTKLLETLKATVFKGASNEELMALVIVSNQYGLNPFTKEIYAFPAKGGGIQPVVSVDGWLRLMNEHPQFDGIEFIETMDAKGKPESCTAVIYRKDRSRPTKVTEWFAEDYRKTEPWDQRPRRMLRHKATIQGVRTAFGFAGITDEDEAVEVPARTIDVFTRPAVMNPDEKAEADAGLAPAEAPKTDESKPVESPQDQLADFVIKNGYDFDTLKQWAIESGNFTQAEAENSQGFSDLPTEKTKLWLKARVGLLGHLARTRAVAIGGSK